MDRYHSNHRHMQNGLAYHFVIGNGTCGCGDGEIEVGRRWKEQLPGGHVKQPWLNESGIGICLVGNFNRQTVTRKQMDSLVKLVNRLRATYGIPLSHIKGHGDFKGERTVCPGNNFSIKRFKALLQKRALTSAPKKSIRGGRATSSRSGGRNTAPSASKKSARNTRRSVS